MLLLTVVESLCCVLQKLNISGSDRPRLGGDRPRLGGLGMLQLEVAASLELGSYTQHTPLRASGYLRFLNPFPSVGLSSLALLSLAATTGRAAATFVTSSPSPVPATSIHQVCPPLLFPSAVRDGAPQTLTKLFVLGSESSYNILSTNFDFVCKRTPMSYVGSAPAHDTAGS